MGIAVGEGQRYHSDVVRGSWNPAHTDRAQVPVPKRAATTRYDKFRDGNGYSYGIAHGLPCGRTTGHEPLATKD